MKILVLSDTHLTPRFEQKKFDFLENIIQKSDSVIINGDFWDGYLTNFDAFIHSKWNSLFPLLKKKQTVYIYGNHDQKTFSDERVSLFSIKQLDQYTLISNGIEYHIEHGNRLIPSIDDIFYQPKKLIYIETLLFSYYEEFITHVFKHSSRIWGVLLNNKLKRDSKKHGIFYIYGHIHFAEFDLKNNFAVSGIFQFGLAQYLLIEDGCIIPKSEWYG